ncbi:MAG: alpha-amylase family glycosyl hydrolase [Acetivibrio sp.]
MQKIKCGNPFPLGVSQTVEGVQFSFYSKDAKKCSLHLFKQGEEAADSILVLDHYRVGDVFTVCFIHEKLKDLRGYEYLYMVDGKIEIDPYAKAISGRENWGIQENPPVLRGKIYEEPFDWEGEKPLKIPYSELFPYRLHVRGFTKHSSSKVEAKGTFAGICEKIPYLQELGINGLFLMPCYEFNERISAPKEDIKLNYWGYGKDAFYFTPKASYARNKENPQNEMKEMIKLLHKAQMEVIMDLYFPEETNPILIMDCIRFWITEYHIDGFRMNENVVLVDIIAKDPLIGSVKLWASYWKEGSCQKGKIRKLAELNDGFLVTARKYLKSDEGQVSAFMYGWRKNPENMGVINYIANTNNFTLMDMVSYDIKHNEDNGEQGKDGTDYNYSWNCGVEGKTRRKSVMALRNKQIKNALLMLYLSQGTPLLLGGDEFGNSQEGNNNPYCQDNKITWLNWNDIQKNKEIYEFVKELIAFRKEHPILHLEEGLKGNDYQSSGYPDLSFHGTKAWYVDESNYSRLLGIMLNGEYKKTADGKTDNSFYLAFNMHWEAHSFDLPRLPSEKRWMVKWDTSEKLSDKDMKNQRDYLVNARTIVVFQSIIYQGENKC